METNITPIATDEHPLDVAARLVGGRSELAQRLNVTVAAVGNWKQRGTPIEYCPRIEVITSKVIGRKILRPDDWSEIWPELAQPPAVTARVAIENVAAGV